MASKSPRVSPDDPLGVTTLDAKAALLNTQHADKLPAKPVFRLKQQLTLPLISMSHRDILVCQCLSEPFAADFELGPTNGTAPTLIRVFDYDANGEALLICNALVISAFERAQGKLTGRYFKLISGELKEGKQFRYREINIAEMEIDNV